MLGRDSSGVAILGPAVAGSWYPATREALEGQLDELFRAGGGAESGSGADAAALIAPHAGFTYSGVVAAQGFRHVQSRGRDRVVLLGPSHHEAFEGAVAPRAETYRTPLGDIPIDTEAVEGLRVLERMRVSDEPFRREHSLEAELPFLQRRLRPGWRLLPLLVGRLEARENARRLADALRPLLGPRTLVVVSSDFTHYGPRFDYLPFLSDVAARIRDLDMQAIDLIVGGDAPGFERFLARTHATICGQNPIRVLLELLPEGLEAELASYDTSGRITGEWGHSVSYASLVFRGAAA